MKKFLIAAIMACLCVFAASAEDTLDLTKPTSQIRFPEDWSLGKWYDAKWDATWEFANNSITLYKGSEKIISFSDNVTDYTCKVSTKGLVMSFSCAETNRTYQFIKPISLSTDIDLVVDRSDVPSSDPNKHWECTMKRQ